MSGVFLLALIYWYGAEIYLIDPSVAALSKPIAIVIGAITLVGGWIVYDLLCKSPLGRDDRKLSAALFLFVALAAFALCQVFSGRGAYIHFGAMLGTIMVANVFFVIMPGQRALVEACREGRAPDPTPGLKAKQRSVHNTYFTLPVIFVMTSNHFAMTYSHEWNWLILVAISVAGALIRIWFVARHGGNPSPWPAAGAVVILLAVAAAIAPQSRAAPSVAAVSFGEVRVVIEHRCVSCHAAEPTHPAFRAAPAGVVFDNDEHILAEADRIHQQTVVTRVMPIGNLTGITEEERQLLDRWYTDLKTGDTP
jgi:uncharacterized membrane protein